MLATLSAHSGTNQTDYEATACSYFELFDHGWSAADRYLFYGSRLIMKMYDREVVNEKDLGEEWG